ncbi:MAG TPA: GNAT family N-acetyltransferase [Candidatus Baltobacteraceae bacterium]|nr:GNAT family N-acetyltransferase [Candidatus Baltobacteraceae bacterium]
MSALPKEPVARRIYDGRVVKLNIERVTLPNGSTIELEMIRHPGAAAVVPLTANGDVILVRQYRHAAAGYLYELPAGKLDPGESPLACAARELEEEVGYRAATLVPLLNVYTTPGFTDEVIYLFLATGLTPSSQRLECDEVLDVVQMPFDEAIARIRDGSIRDAKTVVGLQAVYLRDPGEDAESVAFRPLTTADRDAAVAVINTAAQWYREFLPDTEFHDPEMTAQQWEAEGRRMNWFGAFVEGTLVGVMALEYVQDAALLRHAYIEPEFQRRGIGNMLRKNLEVRVEHGSRIVVGTYAGNYKARNSLEKAGYVLSSNPEAVLRQYYRIPEDRLRSSVTYEKILPPRPGR